MTVATLTRTCTACPHPQDAHEGSKHTGACSGRAPTYCGACGRLAGAEDLPETCDGMLALSPEHAWVTPPCACTRFRAPDRAAERYARALAVANAPISEHLTAWDASRPRSQKTAEARALGQFGVGPSDIGRCPKQIEYRERPPADYVPDEVDRSAAVIGTLLHDAWTTVMRHSAPWRKYGQKITVPGLDRQGETDSWDPILHRITDLKNAFDWKWEQVGRYGPADEDFDQAMLYALGKEHEGEQVAEVEVIYWHIASRQSESFVRPYDRAYALALVNRLHAWIDDLGAGRELERGEPGPSLSPICARFCEAVRHCWGLDTLPPGRRGPESWLKVHDDADIAELLDAYVTAREAETDHKKAKEEAGVLVNGVEPGEYGECTITYTREGRKDVEDVEAMLALAREEIAKPDGIRRTEIPVITRVKVTSSRMNINRLRFAERERRRIEREKAAAAQPVPVPE